MVCLVVLVHCYVLFLLAVDFHALLLSTSFIFGLLGDVRSWLFFFFLSCIEDKMHLMASLVILVKPSISRPAKCTGICKPIAPVLDISSFFSPRVSFCYQDGQFIFFPFPGLSCGFSS